MFEADAMQGEKYREGCCLAVKFPVGEVATDNIKNRRRISIGVINS